MFVLGLNVAGLVGLVAGIYALVWNRHHHRRKPRSRTQLAALGVGIALAAVSPAFVYPFGSDVRVVGLPFTVAIFEGGADFPGRFALLAFAGNMMFWFVCPQIVLRWVHRR